MPNTFRQTIAEMLPSPEAVQARLSVLSNRDRLGVAEFFSERLPEVDVLIATPGAQTLSRELGALRGVPGVTVTALAGHWTLVGSALHQPGDIQPSRGGVRAAVVSLELLGGQPELAAALLAARLGWAVAAVAAAVERTDAPGHVRLSMQGVPVVSPVLLASTPGGLVLERRMPQSA